MSDLDQACRGWLKSLGAQRPALPALNGPQLMYKAPNARSGQLQRTIWNTGTLAKVIAHYKSGDRPRRCRDSPLPEGSFLAFDPPGGRV